MPLILSLVKELRFGIWIAEFYSLGQLGRYCYFALEANWSYHIDRRPLFSSNTHSLYGAYVFPKTSLLLLLIMKSNSLLLRYMGSREHLCLLSLNSRKTMSLHLEDKASLFYFLLTELVLLNNNYKGGKYLPLVIWFYFILCLLVLLRLHLWNAGQEQNASTTIIVTETGESCSYFPCVTYHSEFWLYFYLSFSPLDWHP